MNNYGFDDAAYMAFQEAALERYDFQTCQRGDGSYYGTGGTCRKGTETTKPEKEKKVAKSSGGGEGNAQQAAIAKKEAQLEKAVKVSMMPSSNVQSSMSTYHGNKVARIEGELADLKSGKTKVEVKPVKSADQKAQEKEVRASLKEKGLPASKAAFDRAGTDTKEIQGGLKKLEGLRKKDEDVEGKFYKLIVDTQSQRKLTAKEVAAYNSDKAKVQKELKEVGEPLNKKVNTAIAQNRKLVAESVVSEYKSQGLKPPPWAVDAVKRKGQ